MQHATSWSCQPQRADVVPTGSYEFTPDFLWLPNYTNRLWHKFPDTSFFGPITDPEVYSSGSSSLIAVPGGTAYSNTSRTGYTLWSRRATNIAYPACVGGVFVRTASGGGGIGFSLGSSAGTNITAPRLVIGFDTTNVVRGDVRMARSGGTLSTLLGTTTIPLDTPFAAILIARNATERKLILANETIVSTTSLATVADQWTFVGTQSMYRGGIVSGLDGFTLMGFAASIDPGDTWAQRWVNNPWSILKTPTRWLPDPVAVTVYSPGSDIIVADWVPSTGADLFACIDEVAYDDADFISSPGLGTPTTMGFTSSVPAGTYTIQVRGRYEGVLVGQIRIVMLDAGSSVVGTSAWATQSGTFSTYSLPVTTTGTATKFRIETQ